jgi:hypothetical protein
VDAAEEAYAEFALSADYRHAYGELVNAQMRLRADVQAIAEQAANLLGMPSRTELDSAHRKVAELERQLRRLQRKADDGEPVAAPAKAAAKPAPKPAPKPKPASKVAKKTAKPAAKKTAGKAVKKAAVRRPAKSAARKR